MVKVLLIFVFGFFYIYAVEKHGDHYLEWLNTSSFQEFSARKTGYVTFDENNKPSFLEFNSDQDIQLVSSFCPVSCCLNNKKPDKSFLNRAMWSRVLRGDSGGFVSVSSPEVSSVADVFEVWERYVAPQSDYVYGVNFLGHISLKKEPQNFVEFYSANKWEKNFPQILENAVLKKAPFLFFNAKDNDNDEENQYMFDCFLGSGV
jgi:hypothetical protein